MLHFCFICCFIYSPREWILCATSWREADVWRVTEKNKRNLNRVNLDSGTHFFKLLQRLYVYTGCLWSIPFMFLVTNIYGWLKATLIFNPWAEKFILAKKKKPFNFREIGSIENSFSLSVPQKKVHTQKICINHIICNQILLQVKKTGSLINVTCTYVYVQILQPWCSWILALTIIICWA